MSQIHRFLCKRFDLDTYVEDFPIFQMEIVQVLPGLRSVILKAEYTIELDSTAFYCPYVPLTI